MPLSKDKRREIAKRAIKKFMVERMPGIAAVLATDQIIEKAQAASNPPKRTERTPSAADWAKAEQRAKGRQQRCGFCGEPGHILRTCPQYLKRYR